MEEEQMKQKYMELQMAAEQMKQMNTQLQTLEAKTQEIQNNVNSVSEITGNKNSKMLTPIAEGIFLEAELKSDTHVIVNVGAGVCVEKTVKEAQDMLRDKQQELSQFTQEMHAEVEKAATVVKQLEEELGNMVQSKK